MTEHRFFDAGTVPHVSTFDFHEHRERAPHLEQEVHQARLYAAAAFVLLAAARWQLDTFSDLACGDGGLLSLVQDGFQRGMGAWGYDFQPSNEQGWSDRSVTARALDVFNGSALADGEAEVGQVVAMTEVLEHLADPHGALRRVKQTLAVGILTGPQALVCSSPWGDTPQAHGVEHCWGWDEQGYRLMLEGAGWRVVRHVRVGPFQVVLAQ